MLKAATDGATPSEGPLNRRFKIGNREISIREQYSKPNTCVVHLKQNLVNSMKTLEPHG